MTWRITASPPFSFDGNRPILGYFLDRAMSTETASRSRAPFMRAPAGKPRINVYALNSSVTTLASMKETDRDLNGPLLALRAQVEKAFRETGGTV